MSEDLTPTDELEVEDGAIEIDDEDVLPEPTSDSEHPPSESSPTDEEATQETEPGEEQGKQERGRDFDALAARHRILSRNHEILTQRFNTLLQVIGDASRADSEGREPDVPEPEEDPLGSLIGRLDRIEHASERDREERRLQEQRHSLITEIQAAQQDVVAFRDANPDYQGAADHLLRVTIQEALEEFPNATHEEIQGLLEQETIRRLLDWRRRGLSPGEEIIKMAERRGFQRSQQVSGSDAKQDVQARQRRSRRSSTIGTVPGASGKRKLSVNDAVQMSEEEWADQLSDVPLRQLLAGKAR